MTVLSVPREATERVREEVARGWCLDSFGEGPEA